MKLFFQVERRETTRGQAVMVAVIFLMLISLSVIAGSSLLALRESAAGRVNADGKQSYFIAEAGVEDVAYRILRGKQVSPQEVLVLNGMTATTTTTDAGIDKEIIAQGTAHSAVRKVKMRINPQGSTAQFFYGLQVGAGGMTMGNGTIITGNVYSNGDIHGNAKNSNTITGTAIAAGDHLIEKITISGNASASRFDSCGVGGTATYVSQWTDCTGTTAVASSPAPPVAFPISSDQIVDWESDAVAGGSQGDTSVGANGTLTLGPKKITGDITLGNGATLIVSGTLWIGGKINFGTNNTIRLDPAYGAKSGIVIIDGAIAPNNGAVLQGSGTSGSYLTLLDRFGPGIAIDIGNHALGVILYAPNGTVNAGNGLNIRAVTASAITFGNNETITYDAGLANANFTAGPAGRYSIDQWQEVP